MGGFKDKGRICAQQQMDDIGIAMAVRASVLWGYPLGCSYRGDEDEKDPEVPSNSQKSLSERVSPSS